jgi:hypothetical protein
VLLALSLLASTSLAQARRLPLEFDAGLPASPVTTQQKLQALDGKLPAGFALPQRFVELASAPDGVTTPTTRLWLAPELRDAFARAAQSTSAPMPWPQGTRCAAHRAFTLPGQSLLAAGAPSSCSAAETSVRTQLSAATLGACVDVDEPERYVSASVLQAGLSQADLNTFVDQHTQTLEQQVAFAGAGLSQLPVPDGLLPTDWVPRLRSVLWKVRESTHTLQLNAAHAAYTQALSTLAAQASCFDAPWLVSQLQALDDELLALDTARRSLIADGITEAARQAMCLGTHARVRPSLPLPALTDEEREFIGFWLGGVYWRLRGGGLVSLGSTQNARTFFARRPLREIANLANGTSTGQLAADSLYCAVFDGWGQWMDMGTTAGGQDMYEDLVQMTDRGRQQVSDWTISAVGAALLNGLPNSTSAEAYLSAAHFDTTALVSGGLSMGPCYLYALNPSKNFRYYLSSQAPAPYSDFLEGFTAQGEFCFGASLGLRLTRSFLQGTPTGQPAVNFCGTRTCGSDACGVSCGTCSGGDTCDATGHCAAPVVDAGASDAGATVDAGTPDAGLGGALPDAGLPDAGMADAGAADAGSLDAGAPDAGDGAATPGGCGCLTVPAGELWPLALWLLRRRRR